MSRQDSTPSRPALVVAAQVPLPTPLGVFEASAFETMSGHVYLALSQGDLAAGAPVLTRLHSECMTGDLFGSLRCDCGTQLRSSLRAIAAEGRGVLVYATGHEGRGVGLINKLRAYIEQDLGADTLDANLRLGLPVDARSYDDAGDVLAALGVRSIRLLTNNPAKVAGLAAAGIDVVETVPVATAPHARNLAYLRTKEARLGHLAPTGAVPPELAAVLSSAIDTTGLLGDVRPHPDRPYVVLKFAQTLDGRIATSTGDAKWISGEPERRISHALRAACDAVLVGLGTVLQDDPQLTVRMVPGPSPLRIVLDSCLRIPDSAQVLEHDAATAILTTSRSRPERRAELQQQGVRVDVVEAGDGGVDLPSALGLLRRNGVQSLLVEGGGRVITSMLAAGVVDRIVVGIAPTIIGQGTQAVGPLGITSVADGIRLGQRSMHVLDDDVVFAWDVLSSR
jgi:3,4-dihydroxy 2-butanone 4-phosphate synthase/GTP cyclohydrolase II